MIETRLNYILLLSSFLILTTIIGITNCLFEDQTSLYDW
jgi:hypothetical protein